MIRLVLVLLAPLCLSGCLSRASYDSLGPGELPTLKPCNVTRCSIELKGSHVLPSFTLAAPGGELRHFRSVVRADGTVALLEGQASAAVSSSCPIAVSQGPFEEGRGLCKVAADGTVEVGGWRDVATFPPSTHVVELDPDPTGDQATIRVHRPAGGRWEVVSEQRTASPERGENVVLRRIAFVGLAPVLLALDVAVVPLQIFLLAWVWV